jgi:SnoaL-like domain
MTRDKAIALAHHWIDSWNAQDVESVLSHFDDAVRFTSPRAAEVTGIGVVEGKEALRAYWRAALALVESIRFSLDHVLWDDERREMTIVYVSERGGRRIRACEFLRFGDSERAIEGEAMYGAPL